MGSQLQANHPVLLSMFDAHKKPSFAAFVVTGWVSDNSDIKVGMGLYIVKSRKPMKDGSYSYFVRPATDSMMNYAVKGVDCNGYWLCSYVGYREAQ